MNPSSWLHEPAFKCRGYDQGYLAEVADWRSPVIDDKYVLVVEVI